MATETKARTAAGDYRRPEFQVELFEHFRGFEARPPRYAARDGRIRRSDSHLLSPGLTIENALNRGRSTSR